MYGGRFPPLGHSDVVGAPPVSFSDRKGRNIDIREFGDGPVDDEFEALVGMYLDYDPRHRSLGLPPRSERKIRQWQDRLLEGFCVLAWHDETLAGQATLVETGPEECELVIFLHQTYHGAGIGTRLLEALLSYGREAGVRRVWLVVERNNRAAVNLYFDVGFVIDEYCGADVEMEVTIEPPLGSQECMEAVHS